MSTTIVIARTIRSADIARDAEIDEIFVEEHEVDATTQQYFVTSWDGREAWDLGGGPARDLAQARQIAASLIAEARS